MSAIPSHGDVLAMSPPASAAELKRAEAAEHSFLVRPPLRQRFPVAVAKEVIRAVFREKLPPDVKYAPDLGKSVAETLRDALKALELPRFKIIVHVTVGENRGEGVRVATRCLWDKTTDAMACEAVTTDAVFAVATAYAVYLY